jgi:hypothetical protein
MKKFIYSLLFVGLATAAQTQVSDPEPLSFMFSPNPVHDWIHLEVSMEVELQLIDIRGEMVLEASGFRAGDLDMSRLPQGIYFLKISTPNQVQTARIVRLSYSNE